MADQFDGWTKLLELAGIHRTKTGLRKAIIDAGLIILETEPLSGYYRCASVKDGPLLPIAIWRDEANVLRILRAGEPVALERVWPYAAWNPVSYEWYEAKVERGEKWPDEHVDLAPQAGEDVPAANRDVARNDNNAPEQDEAEALKSQIENAKGSAEKQYKEITSDDQAAQAQAARSRLNELAGTADKKREAEKRPHFEKCKEIDGKWNPLVKLAKGAADAIRFAISAYETKKFHAEQAAQRKAEEEAAAARALAPVDDPGGVEERPEETAPIAPITTTGTIKGASGRAATVRTIKVAKVVDYDKAFAALKAIPEIKQAIDKVAQRLVTAGQNIPGVDVEEQRDVA